MKLHQHALVLLLTITITITLATTSALAGPVVVPTAEGQIGETPGMNDKIFGPPSFESIRGQAGEVVFSRIIVPGGAVPPPPEFQFLTDMIHGYPDPMPVPVASTASVFTSVDKVTPDSGWSRTAADDGDFVAFSFAVDGTMPQTATIRIATFDETGSAMVQVPIIENLETFMIPQATFSKTGVAVDNQGRATVAYTAFVGGLPQVRATRVNSETGALLDPDFLIADNIRANPGVALLDPAGNRLIIATDELVNPPNIRGNIVDFTGGTPAIGPEFLINDTPATFGAVNPAVASDPATGNFTVVWDFFTGTAGDPTDVRGRRFDAMGNPLGGDFRVNSTANNAQGQPAVAYGVEGLSAIAWAADPLVPQMPNDLDVFLQVYDPMGNPIGGQVQVNTFTDNVQDRPAVRFLPDRDSQGRPQVAVTWRDVGDPEGGQPRGTGVSYRCFSINGFEQDMMPIFADGFESGDTSSWSDTQP